MTLSDIWDLIKETFIQWKKHHADRLAASLAYYAIFSVVPLILVVIAIGGIVYGPAAAQGKIVDALVHFIGERQAFGLQSMILSAQARGRGATIIGLILLWYGGSNLFDHLRRALNMIWDVEESQAHGIRNYFKNKGLALVTAFGLGIVLLLFLIFSGVTTAFSGYTNAFSGGGVVLYVILDYVISFLGVGLIMALIYKTLPAAVVAWGDVWIGACVTSLLFIFGKVVISFYLSTSMVSTVYGLAGSLIVLLLWFSYTAQILLFGAEFTNVYSNNFGSGIKSKRSRIGRVIDGMKS